VASRRADLETDPQPAELRRLGAPAGARGASRRGRRSALVWATAFVALVGVRVAVVVVALDQDATRGRRTVLPGDVRRYHRIATSTGVPYRDFEVEYPPVTLGAIELLDGPTVRASTVALMWSQLATDVAIAALVGWGWGRRAAIAYLILGTAFLVYPFLYLRLDLLSVALAVAALALVRRRHPTAGALTLAVACFAKLWPLVLVPRWLFVRSRRAVVAFGAALVAGTTAWMVLGSPDGPVQVLTFRGATGWQIESTVGAFVHVFSADRVRNIGGAYRVGAVAASVELTLAALGCGAVLAAWWCVARSGRRSPGLLDGVAPVAATAALLVTATILSPQYVAWLLPFSAIAFTYGERRVAGLTFLASLLSVVGLNLVNELRAGSPLAMGVVLVRNAVLVALIVVAFGRLVAVARRRRPIEVLPDARRRVA
jgi:hypothetical protein